MEWASARKIVTVQLFLDSQQTNIISTIQRTGKLCARGVTSNQPKSFVVVSTSIFM